MATLSNQKKKNILNRMGFAAQQTKLGTMIPVAVTKKLAAGDISNSKCVISMGFEPTAVCSAIVTASGVLRAVTKAEIGSTNKDTVEVTATSMAANDIVTVVAI